MKRQLTPQDVRWAYRLLLGREPESSDVIVLGIEKFQFVDDFVEAILDSEEFSSRKKVDKQ